MSWDIFGNPLQRGHCEVHPHVHEEYPCSVCISEKKQREQPSCDGNCESGHYLAQAQDHMKSLQARVAELEAICENVPEGCTPADARVLREANHAMVDEVARLNSLCESLNDTARHNFSVAVEIGEKLQSEKWHKDVAEAALLSVEKERDGLASKLKLVIDCGDSCCDEYCKDEWELAVNASADKAIAKLKADAVREALNKLAAEYAPEGLRATYTAFAVSQHISAQADYYASQIEREGGV